MARVYILEHGCAGSIVESQSMPMLLEEAGFTIVDEPSEVNIVNVCASKGDPVELLGSIVEKNSGKLIVTGCLSKDLIASIRKVSQDASLVNIENIHKIVSFVEESLQGNVLEAVVQEKFLKSLPVIRNNRISVLIPIGSGCEDNCAYCSTSKVSMRSYPTDYVVNEVSKAVTLGCKEVFLTSADNGSYSEGLPALLKAILDNVQGDYRIKMGTISPRHAMSLIDDIMAVLHDPRVFRFLHIPADSGSNEVLGKMKRPYTVHDYRQLVDKLRRAFPDVSIVTNMVVGFPTETELQFQDSLNLMQEIRFDAVNISRHLSKGKVEGLIGANVKKERLREMSDFADRLSLEVNRKWIGWEGPVTIIGKGNTLVGRNYAFKPIVIPSNGHQVGDEINVKVLYAMPYDLRGKPIEKVED